MTNNEISDVISNSQRELERLSNAFEKIKNTTIHANKECAKAGSLMTKVGNYITYKFHYFSIMPDPQPIYKCIVASLALYMKIYNWIIEWDCKIMYCNDEGN